MSDKNSITPSESGTVTTEKKTDAAPVRNKYADKMNRPKKRLPKKVRVTLTVLILALVIGGGVWLVQMSKQAGTPVETLQTATAMRGMLETYVEGTGMTAAKTKAELGKDIKGTVTEVLVQVGDTVHVGDTLLVIDAKDTRKELDTARSELDDASRAVDEAVQGVADAQKNLQNLTVTAPFSGKLIPITDDKGAAPSFKVGQEISSGTTLGLLVDDTTMHLPLYFSTAYENDIQTGASATVSIPASMSSVPGKVESIERVQKVSDDGSVLFRVIVSMRNPGSLKKDMVATASISTGAGELMPAESGKLEYTREEQIVTKGEGEIVSVGTLDYARFSAGQTICRLQNDKYQSAIETAQRSVEGARKTLETKQERIAELEKLLAESTVKATIDGIVTNITCAEGDTLEGNTVPCTVADLSSIVVNVDISELDIDKVANGMPAMITMDYDESQLFTGTVSTVSMQASTNNNQGGSQGSGLTFPVTITLDDPGSLAPDRSVACKITSASKEDCIMVPSTAIVYSEQGAAVYVRKAEGQTFDNELPLPEGSEVPEGFALVSVETGIFDDTNTEILSGIEEGAEVFLAGPQDPFADMNGGAVMVG